MIDRPVLPAPGPADTKYTRGMVVIVGGAMPGAARLAARAAMRGGAGYVVLAADGWQPGLPDALVQRAIADAGALHMLLADDRVSAVVVGPGLGRDERAGWRLEESLAARAPLIVDGDALSLLGADVAERIAGRSAATILTPHDGEFARLFGKGGGDRAKRTVAAARATGAVVVRKGAATVVASPNAGAQADAAPHWLASAGTGDVLAGLIAARLAQRDADAFAAACAGVWLHRRAAELAGPALIADDLVGHVRIAVGECLTD